MDTPSPDREEPFSERRLGAFRNFLRKHLPDAETAEDILQQNLLKALEEGHWDEKENPVAWFYRVLRNSIADHYRTKAARERQNALYEAEAVAVPSEAEFEREVEAEACTCFRNLLPELKPEYGALLQAIDLEGRPSKEVAQELGITPNNLMVRLHRSRSALRSRLQSTCGVCSEHGCLNCSCQSSKAH